jgi:hypothetical protein
MGRNRGSLPPLELDSVIPPPTKPPSRRSRSNRPASKRPKALAAEPPVEEPVALGESDFSLEDDDWGGALDEFEARFDAARRKTDQPPSRRSDPGRLDLVTSAEDLASVRRLFEEIAVPFMSPVRDFVLELRRGPASASFLELCEPAVQSLRSSSDPLGMPALVEALDGFQALLARAKLESGASVGGEVREQILTSYDRLLELLPEAFEVGTGREAMLVQLLLLQVPGVHKLTLDKLHRAGLYGFDAFFAARADELAAVSGIELELAGRIVDRFAGYRERMSSLLASFTPAEERKNLGRLTAELRDRQSAFERASAGWSKEAKAEKKLLRKQRGDTLSEIYVVLARLGETARIDRLKTLSVDAQLEELERYLLTLR